ncbi:hypothetical protein CP02DC21_1401, partial [Chlamydia psittaci 02DC21]
IFPFSP